MALPYVVAGKVINAGADALDYKLPSWVKTALDPMGAAKNYAAKKAEEALDLAPGSIGLATNPSGFAKGLAKDVGKDYVKDAFVEKEPVPVEDRIPSMASSIPDFDSGSMSSMEWEGDYKRGGKVKAKASVKSSKPKVSSASRRGDGIAQRGKTRGRMV
jgi:hypothetical protein